MVKMVVDGDDWQSLQDNIRINEGKLLDLKVIIKELLKTIDENNYMVHSAKSLAYLKGVEAVKDI
jgi:hypothetical protein